MRVGNTYNTPRSAQKPETETETELELEPEPEPGRNHVANEAKTQVRSQAKPEATSMSLPSGSDG